MPTLKKQFLGVVIGAMAMCMMGVTSAMAVPTVTIDGITLPLGTTSGGFTFSTQTLYENVVTTAGDVNVGAGQVNLIGPSSGPPNTYLYGQDGLYVNFIVSGFTVANIDPPTATTAGAVDFTGGTVSFYVDTAPLSVSGTQASVEAAIQSGTLLLEMTAEVTTGSGYTIVATLPAGSSTNAFSAAGSTGYFGVTGGDAQGAILPDSFLNPFSTITVGTSDPGYAAIIFTSSDSTVCGTNAYSTAQPSACGTTQPQEFVNGSGQAKWNTIPEPSTLALMGTGLLGLLFISRRRSQKKSA